MINIIKELLNIDRSLFYGDKEHAHYLITTLIQELQEEDKKRAARE